MFKCSSCYIADACSKCSLEQLEQSEQLQQLEHLEQLEQLQHFMSSPSKGACQPLAGARDESSRTMIFVIPSNSRELRGIFL